MAIIEQRMRLPPTTNIVVAPYQAADTILAGLPTQGRIVGLHKGQTSLADLTVAAAEQAQAPAVLLHSWGMSLEDMALLHRFSQRGGRVVLRLDNKRAGEERFALARQLFGADNVTTSALHAEIGMARGPRGNIAIRGSMGMNRNAAFQQLDISDSPETCATIEAAHAAPQLKCRFPKPAPAATAARTALAPLVPGKHIFAITSGYSSADLVAAALDRTGPADVTITTWGSETANLHTVRTHPNTRSLRLVLGEGFVSHERERARQALALVGSENLRVARTHAKVTTIRNATWNLVIRGSMNLTANPRAEQFDIDDSPDIANFFDAWTDDIFSAIRPGVQGSLAPILQHFRRALGGGISDAYRLDAPMEERDVPIDLARFFATSTPIALDLAAPAPVALDMSPPRPIQ